MQDRTPTYPGRVTLTPVTGQDNTYDMAMADQPSAVGTPLNKATLLTDETISKYSGIYNGRLGNVPVGGTVKLNVGGTETDFIVIQQGNPDETLYVASGTWLLAKNVYEIRPWDTAGGNSYEASTIHAYLNGTFLGLLSNAVQGKVQTVKVPYRAGAGSGTAVSSGAYGLSTKVFLLSPAEVGYGATLVPAEGAILSYFNGAGSAARIAYYNGATAMWWMRTPYVDNELTNAAYIIINGGTPNYNLTTNASTGVRPCLVLDPDVAVAPNGLISGAETDVVPDNIFDVLSNAAFVASGVITDISGTPIGPRIECGSYTGTGTYGTDNRNSLTFGFVPQFVVIIEDYYSSGTFQLHYGMFSNSARSGIMAYTGGNGAALILSWSDSTMTWYNASNAANQLNTSGRPYAYIAIG